MKCLQKAQVVAYKQELNIMNEKNLLLEAVHPFVLNLIATFKDDHQLYMLMELVQGGELFSLLHNQGGKIPTKDAQFYGACVVSALSFLHSKCIVYRDLKPENLLIDRLGFCKVSLISNYNLGVPLLTKLCMYEIIFMTDCRFRIRKGSQR